MRLKHGVQQALDKRDFVGRVRRGELRQWVARRIDQRVDKWAGALAVAVEGALSFGAADFEVEGGDGRVGGGDVRVEVVLGDVFLQDLSSFW